MGSRERSAITALALITLITVGWWALALWPLSSEAPAWLTRAKYVCFGSAESGLPDASGWTALILQPLLMYGALVGIWGASIPAGLRRLWAKGIGRLGLAAVVLVLVGGSLAAVARVVDAASRSSASAFEVVDEEVPETYPRLDRPAPPIDLVDQTGATLDLDRLAGRTTIVTFAFAHCSTICPLLVRDALRTQRLMREEGVLVNVVVMTLDPWRDLPSRLPAIAEKWGLGRDAYVVSGEKEAVHQALEAWQVPWQRNERTGDIVHPRLTFVVDAAGTIAYGASGGEKQLTELTRRATQ